MDVNMMSGWDETWIDTDDLRIVTCRLTCGYADWFDTACYALDRIGFQSRKASPEGDGSQGAR